MESVQMYKYLGLLYFVILWSAMIYILRREPHDKTKTISRHAAVYKHTFIGFAIARTITIPLWILFAFGWLIPMLELPLAASILFAVAIPADFISAWVPAIEGRKGKVHKLSTVSVGSMYVPVCIMFALSPHVSVPAQIIIWTDIALMAGCGFLFATRKESKNYYLYFQLSYFLFFDTAFLAAAFL